MYRNLRSTAVVTIAAALLAAGAGADTNAVSTRGYWRYFYAFGPPRFYSHDGKLVATAARYASLNGGDSGNQLATEPPPANWTSADFDDTRWCVQRAPLPFQPEVDSDGSGPYSLDCIRRVCSRTRFVVDNPAAAAGQTLDVTFYGGLIVYLNGREIGRSHIPASGPLADASYAEPYPPDAYKPVTPEQKAWGMVGANGCWNPSAYWVPWYQGVKPQDKANYEAFAAYVGGVRRRSLSIALDASMLQRGVNVLAIENRCSPMIEIAAGKTNTYFVPAPSGGYSPRMAHIGIHAVGLRHPTAGGAAAPGRPDRVQAWVEDPHRWLLAEDYLEPGVKELRTLRLVGAPGGTCSGQAVIGTRAALSAPSAAFSGFSGAGGSKLPADATRIRWARTVSVTDVKRDNPGAFRTYIEDLLFFRYRNGGVDVHFHDGRSAIWEKGSLMRLYDPLAPEPPAKIAADTSQPVWLTVQIPRQAAPGLYTGQLRVKADGMEDAVFAVRL